MNQSFCKYWKWMLTMLYGIGVAYYWGTQSEPVLSFQEQYQLFLTGTDYFQERMSVPGGLADYLGEFLTQFYYIPVIGACILALLGVALQVQVWLLARRNGAADAYYPLSFIPSLLLWAYMGEENVLLSFSVAMILALASLLLYHMVCGNEGIHVHKWRKIAFIAFFVPLAYWLIGPCMMMTVIYIAAYECIRHRSLGGWLFGIGEIVYALAVILLCSKHLQYPLFNLFAGINYYRYPTYQPAMQIAVQTATALMPLVLPMLPSMVKAAKVAPICTVVIAVCGWWMIGRSFDPLKYSLIEYDFMVRTRQWGKIIEKAERQQPSKPFDVACLNLALAMKGQLSDRLFDFFQNGAEGLFPSFQRDMTTPLPTCETFYYLGMVNDAERYAFEAQEAIPNHRKSGRLMKRIIECNIINGHYEVAMKYLRMLEKTVFYRAWAKKQKEIIKEGKVDSDPVYGKLRAFRQKKQDYLFSDTEMDQMLGLLFVQNYDNRMAYEFLMCYELLQCDLERFNAYYPLGKYAKFNHIPKAYQQALVMQWTQQHGSFEGMPWSIDPATCQMLSNFVGKYMNNKNDPLLSVPPLGNTFWSYMMVRQEGKEKKGKEQMKEVY